MIAAETRCSPGTAQKGLFKATRNQRQPRYCAMNQPPSPFHADGLAYAIDFRCATVPNQAKTDWCKEVDWPFSMYKHETFPNAPITEALIDIRTTPSGEGAFELLAEFANRLSDRFPTNELREEHTTKIKIDGDKGLSETRTTTRKIGYALFAENREKAVQGRVDGFTFSKLKPYESWEALRDEAQDIWSIYHEIMKPNEAVRLAVRYINRIELPLPLTRFEDYIQTVPQIAAGVPEGLSEFFMRLVIPKPDDQIRAIVTSTMEQSVDDESILPYIFDIDAFIPVSLNPASEEVWAIFERLRDYKNLIFFSSMTEKAKENFR